MTQTTLIFCLIYTFVQLEINHWERPDKFAICSFHNDGVLIMPQFYLIRQAYFFRPLHRKSLFNLTKISHK